MCPVRHRYTRIAGTEVVALDELAETLKLRGICDAVSDIPYRNLQIYHYRTRDEQYYLISNEDTGGTYQGNITIPVCGILYRYDAFANELYTVAYETIPQEGGRDVAKTRIKLTLEPYEMAVLVIARMKNAIRTVQRAPYTMGTKVAQMTDGFHVSFVENENYPQFADAITMQQPENVLRYKPDFSGVIRYEGTVTLPAEKELILSIEDAYESVEVWCNGTYAGERICPPYRFDISGLTHEGTNDIQHGGAHHSRAQGACADRWNESVWSAVWRGTAQRHHWQRRYKKESRVWEININWI